MTDFFPNTKTLAIQGQEVKNKHQINKEFSNEQQKVKKLQAEPARKDKELADTADLLSSMSLGQQRGRLTPLSVR